MKLSISKNLRIEQEAREEALIQLAEWHSGYYNFLLQRIAHYYKLMKVKSRRSLLESECRITFPEINDPMLFELYKYACRKHMSRCHALNGAINSGFQKTTSERIFLKTLENVIRTNPELKYIEIYPSERYSKDLHPDFKMVVGSYVPDFILFGIKKSGSSAVAIEIDGDSHISKQKKDELRQSHLNELKIFSFSIPNEQVSDFEYVTKLIKKMHRHRSGALDKQILRIKRHIWLKTVACQMSLDEIERFVSDRFHVQLNLVAECKALLQLSTCPKKIKREILVSIKR